MTGQGALSPGFAGFQNLDAQTHVDTRFAPVPESAQRAELEPSDEFCTTTFRVVPHPSRGSTAFRILHQCQKRKSRGYRRPHIIGVVNTAEPFEEYSTFGSVHNGTANSGADKGIRGTSGLAPGSNA